MKLLQAPFFAGLTLRTIPAVEECNWTSQRSQGEQPGKCSVVISLVLAVHQRIMIMQFA